MTASATHELRNVLAVVKESAGLVEDLVGLAHRRGSLDEAQLSRAVRRIDDQVQRGADLLTHLNRLAHGLDHAEEQIALGEHVRLTASLYQRFARMRRLEITVEAADDVFIHANALALHLAIGAALDCCLELLPEGATITVAVGRHDHRAVIACGAANPAAGLPPATGAAAWNQLTTAAERVSATVEATDTPRGVKLIFSGVGIAG
jgi:signal transduction histidine kinase